MRMIGVLFIVLSAGSVGFRIAGSLSYKCKQARQLLNLLQILKNEISLCSTPLPQAFALLSVAAEGELKTIFSEVARAMDKQRWLKPETAMQTALEKTPLEPFGSVLMELCAKLGKYDTEAQEQGIGAASMQTQALLQTLEREKSLKSKTYETLGICAGLALAILLI